MPDQNICESFDRPKHIKPQKLSFLKSAGQIIAILDINLTTEWISLATKYSHSTTASENKLCPKWIYQNVRFLSISPLRTTFPLNLKDDMILLIMVCNSYLQRTNVSNRSFLHKKRSYTKHPCFQFSVFNINKEMVLGYQIGTLESFMKNWSNGFATAGINLIDPLRTQVLTYYSMLHAIYMALRMCIFVS